MRRLYMYIDFFRKQTCTNDMGHMFGSSLFQSLEENMFYEVTDEITNVYTVGATAFALFENITAHATSGISDKLFAVATKAVSDDRAKRQQSIRQLRKELETAICENTYMS